MSKVKKIVILVVALALLAGTGTFAWVNFSQSAANEFKGTVNNGGTGHDDFCNHKKDVYVENWGSSLLYVRVKLAEYMEVGQGAGLYVGDVNGNRTADPANQAASLIPSASITDLTTWTAHVPSTAVNVCSTPAEFHKYWEWTMGGSKYYMPADHAAAVADPSYVASDTTEYDQNSPGVQETLNAEVMTMAQWVGLGSPIGNYWVIDTDGWAYWAAPLQPGTATGLLLSAVTPAQVPDEDYYYAINVVYQMATKTGDQNYTDFYNNGNTATAEGQALLTKITSYQPVASVALTSAQGTTVGNVITVPAGTATTLNMTATVTLTADGNTAGATTGVTWALDSTTGFGFTPGPNNTGALAIAATVPTGTTYTLKATSQADPSKSDTKIIKVQ